MQAFLLWAREKGFRVRQLEANGLRVELDGLRIDQGGPPAKAPRDVHHAFAQEFGIPTLANDEEDEELTS